MAWMLTDDRDRIVAGPFDTPMDAVSDRHGAYRRIHKRDDGAYDVECGYSAFDHDDLLLVPV